MAICTLTIRFSGAAWPAWMPVCRSQLDGLHELESTLLKGGCIGDFIGNHYRAY